jgi:hypothetical protein
MFVIRKSDESCTIRYNQIAYDSVILRFHNHLWCTTESRGQASTSTGYIIGCVAYVGIEI